MVPDDNELIEWSRSGDMRAFEELVHRYDRRVLGIALNFVHDEDEAKDIYQEVFLRVHRALGRFRFESQFSTWIYRITTNVCLSHQARQRRRVHLSIERDLQSTRDGQPASPPPELAIEAAAEQYTYGGEIGVHIGRALEALSPQQRMVFVLRHYQGHKLREIGSILECAEGTVKKHLFDATERMRQQLDVHVTSGIDDAT
jgi:RNA polymerase sigma-70 factor (ECF subfamily)